MLGRQIAESMRQQKAEMHSLALNLGYVQDSKNIGTCYVKDGTKHVWNVVSSGTLKWQTADIVEGRFTGHQLFDYDDWANALRRW